MPLSCSELLLLVVLVGQFSGNSVFSVVVAVVPVGLRVSSAVSEASVN